jgi:tetratricopeptide (TPR) repeat protein
VSPTDDFGPDLKAWLEATKLKDQDAASRAAQALQRKRAERNLSNLDDVAGAIAGRAEVLSIEGAKADAVEASNLAVRFAPDSAAHLVSKAGVEGKAGEAWRALDLAWSNPFEHGRLLSALLLGLLGASALFTLGFSLALLIRYAAVFSHDVAEGLSPSLKPLALFMAVLFLALPLAGFMGWGYLPFWWITLFFIFESRAEKTVSIVLLAGLALASLAVPAINHQRTVESARSARPLYLAATGGTSAEAEALVKERLAADPADLEWSLLSANLARRAGRLDEAAAALQARASVDSRFAHNAAALELYKGNFAGAQPGFTQASEGSLSATDRATALYNLSLVQVNTLAFDQSKESRRKGDALDAPTLARFEQLFTFSREGSDLKAPPDIVPDPSRILGDALPGLHVTAENAVSRLAVVAVALLLFIPGVMRFRGVQSFSKQCPKCGTTFCWLCQTRSTSQDVCSQCHHLFVVKRGIPPAARAAKTQEINRHAARRNWLHRLASLAAPGAGHLSVGHFVLGLPLLLVWATALGGLLTVQYFAPLLVAGGPLGATLKTGFGVLVVLTYVAAQAVKVRAPVVALAPRRRVKAGEEA